MTDEPAKPAHPPRAAKRPARRFRKMGRLPRRIVPTGHITRHGLIPIVQSTLKS